MPEVVFGNIRISIEKRKVTCLIVKKMTTHQQPAIPKSKGLYLYEKINDSSHVFKNAPLSSVISEIRWKNRGPNTKPIIDETNNGINLELNCKLTDLQCIKKELEKHGVTLVEQQRIIKIMVIKDRNDFDQ